MRLLPLLELPEQVIFWRKDHHFRWVKLDGLNISPLAKVPLEEALVKGDANEIVLSDPNWCSDCWEQTSSWPPLGPCSHCGSENIPRTFEESKRRISDWTGLSDPHI